MQGVKSLPGVRSYLSSVLLLPLPDLFPHPPRGKVQHSLYKMDTVKVLALAAASGINGGMSHGSPILE